MCEPSAMALPRLVVGLGNPGGRYAETRHNAGFLVVDRVLARCTRLSGPEPGGESECWTVRTPAGRQLWLQKPLTFMNRSGAAVAAAAQALGASPGDVLVVCDCLDLPLGRLRLRPGGSSGGHRGLESVLAALGTEAVPRLRIGIGRQDDVAVVAYVLAEWSPAEQRLAEPVLDAAADAVLSAVTDGVEATMNRFNGWRAAEPPPENANPGGDTGP